MVGLNSVLSPGVGQLNIKWCHCLQTTSWKVYIMHYALDVITHTKHPPTHILLLSLTVSLSHTHKHTPHKHAGTFIEQQSHCFADLDKIVLLSKMETPQNFSSKCTNTKACGLSSIAFMSLPLPSL